MDGINKPKRSLREILPKKIGPTSRPGERPHHVDDMVSEPVAHQYEPTPEAERYSPPPRPPQRSSGRKIWWSAGIAALLIVIFVGSSLFAQATVNVTPRQGKLLLSGTQEASREQGDGGLTFQVMSFTDTASKVVKASGTEHVERKASGQITIANTFSTSPQELIANTRFESADGKIYRIESPVTVPGAGADGAPGVIDVTVVADQSGTDYNVDQATFTIPGFKGSPRYEKFTARTKTPLSGGFSGEAKTVAAEERAQIRAELQGVLKDQVLKNAKLQLPPDFILFDDAVFLSFAEDIGTSTVATDEVELREKAILTGIIFNVKELSKYYAVTQVADYNGEDLTINNPEELQFKLLNKETLNPNEAQDISFTLEGNAHLVWAYDVEDLKSRLRSAPNGDYQAIFAKYPAIEKAEVLFRPPWIRSFPEDPAKMKIVTTLTE